MKKELPVYELKLNELDVDGLTAISIVTDPAIQKPFMKFSNIKMKIENDDEKIITGPALIPNMLIFRRSPQYGEHNVFFSENTIKELAIKYLSENKQNNVTVEHQYNANHISLFESWIIENPENDKANALGFSDLPKGTWMISMKIQNESVWNQIRDGELDGFSIEAYLSKVLDKFAEDKDIDDDVLNILNSDKSDDEKFNDLIEFLDK